MPLGLGRPSGGRKEAHCITSPWDVCEDCRRRPSRFFVKGCGEMKISDPAEVVVLCPEYGPRAGAAGAVEVLTIPS